MVSYVLLRSNSSSATTTNGESGLRLDVEEDGLATSGSGGRTGCWEYSKLSTAEA
jgi:hypothetical protein